MVNCIVLYISTKEIVSEGFTVISEETNALLLDTFDNIEEEEFFEVITIFVIMYSWIVNVFFAGLGQHRACATWGGQQSVPQAELQAAYLLCSPKDKPRAGTNCRLFAAGRLLRMVL